MRNRFSKFIPQTPKKESLKRKKGPEDASRSKSLKNRRKGFLTKIYSSLNECGLKISYTMVVVLFLIYVSMSFFIGSNIISNGYFPKLPKGKTVEEIFANPEYEMVESGMEIIASKKSNLDSQFVNLIKQDKFVTAKIDANAITSGKSLTDKDKEELNKKINEIGNNLVSKAFKRANNLPQMEVDFSSLNFSKQSIVEELKKSNTPQDKITDEEIKNIAISKVNAFYGGLGNAFKEYLIANFKYEMIKAINPFRQKFLFNLAFGLIFAFIGLTIFGVYLYEVVANMSLKRMRVDLPPWIQMFTNSIQAGYSLGQAFDFTKDKVKRNPLSSIIKGITARYETYKDLKMALEPMSSWEDRIPEVKLLVSTLKVQQEKGGNIIPVLYSLSKLISKRDLFAQKVESIASEAMGQLKIIFVLFFGLILVAEKFFNFNQSTFSPFFSFCSKGGGFAGLFQVAFIHILLFFISYALWFIGSKLIQGEIRF